MSASAVENEMINKRNFLGVESGPGGKRALMLAGLSAAFILGALWYTVLTGDYGATSGSGNPANFSLTAQRTR